MITKAVPISTRVVICYVMKQASRFEFGKKSKETDTTASSEFPKGRKAIVEQILATEELNKSKRAALQES